MKKDPAVGGLLVLSRNSRSMEEDEEVRDRIQSLQLCRDCSTNKPILHWLHLVIVQVIQCLLHRLRHALHIKHNVTTQ